MKYSEKIFSKSKCVSKSLRLVASTLDRDSVPKFLNLGSYPLKEEDYLTEKLKNNQELITHIKEKLAEKISSGSQLIEILGFYGKNTNKFTIYDQSKTQILFYSESIKD